MTHILFLVNPLADIVVLSERLKHSAPDVNGPTQRTPEVLFRDFEVPALLVNDRENPT